MMFKVENINGLVYRIFPTRAAAERSRRELTLLIGVPFVVRSVR